MNTFNDDNELKHPAFHDEQIEKKQRIWSFLFYILIVFVLGLVAWTLFCFYG